ncbi:hypothetical protein [Ktedonospora formicarum]|uniref:Uncharacterized protein n=1 Tax=Ktedonospora formicarum TaxID=2778364 RepID=A0A8J3I0B6_9CHLR|nr:hypothetical protein [Ktedonospora formicarum]GHO43204.1 hypothetical protein KSX_13670 [Ktedonospora formicarum]
MASLVKLVALIGGATVGALIANWLDEQIMERSRKRSEYDRSRYEQGLGPITTTRSGEKISSEEVPHE